MNRWDEVQATARNIASNVHQDPVARDAMADELIKLCGLIVGAVGKVVAVEAETAMNDNEDAELDTESMDYTDAEVAEFEAGKAAEHASAYTRYLVGERLQTAAAEAVAESTNPKVDLDRWRAETPSDPCTCRHVPSVHQDGGVCTGEQFNGEPCQGGPCNAYVRAEPKGGWVHTDRRPDALRDEAPATATDVCSCDPLTFCKADGSGVAVHATGCVAKPGVTERFDASPATDDAADDAPVPQFGAVVYPQHRTPHLASQGIVLDYLDGRPDRVIVWWPAKGPATGRSCSGEFLAELQQTGTVMDLSADRQEELLVRIGSYPKAAQVRAMLDVAFKATPVAASATCCHGNGHCPWSRVKAGGCCFPKSDVCPLHH